MADPLSVAASFAGLLEISGFIISQGLRYILAVRPAPEALDHLFRETAALNHLLSQLVSLPSPAVSSASGRGLTALSGYGTIQSCKALLERLGKLLAKCQQHQGERAKNWIKALSWPAFETEVNKLLQDIHRLQGLFQSALFIDNSEALQRLEAQLGDFRKQEVDELRSLSHTTLETALENQTAIAVLTQSSIDAEYRQILSWLSPIDCWPKHYAVTALRQPETGQWLFREAIFEGWVEGGCLLWICGTSGMGKTVLASTIINKLQESICQQANLRSGVAFHYCDFAIEDSLDATILFGSLLRQLAAQKRPFPECVRTTHGKLIGRNSLDLYKLLDLLTQLVESEFDRVFLIIDGLDEIPQRKDSMEALRILSQSRVASKLKILILSRRECDIQQFFPDESTFCMEARHIANDIELYVKSEFEQQPKLKRLSNPKKSNIINSLCSRAEGVFRWVHCQIDTLCGARTPFALDKTLKELPSGLEETYDRILRKVLPPNRELVRPALCWLVGSFQPLAVAELAEAMAVDTEQLDFNPEKRLFDAEELFDMCGGLVRLSSDGTTIGLAHYSVKEYLLSPQLADKEPSLSYFAIDQAQCLDKTAVGLLVYVFYLGLKLHSAEGLTLSDDHYPLLTHVRHLWQRKLYHHKQGPDQKWLDSLLSVSCDRFAPMWAQMINTKDVVYNPNNNFSLTNFVHDVVDVTVLAFLEKGLNSSTDVETDIFANLNDYLKMISGPPD